MRAPARVASLLGFTVVLFACSSDSRTGPDPDPGVIPNPNPNPSPGDTTPLPPAAGLPPGLRLILDRTLVEVDQERTATFSARIVDSAGQTVTDIPISFVAGGGAPLTVTQEGVVTGVRPGAGIVEVRAGGKPVDSVDVDVFGRPEGLIAGNAGLSSRPFGAAVSKNGVVYVTRLDAGNMAVTNVRQRAITGTIPVGSVPTGVTFNKEGTLAYVTNQYSGNVGIVDVATSSQVGTIDVAGDPFVVRVAPSGTKLYITSNADLVSIADLRTGSVTKTIPVGFAPNGFAVTPDESRIYVASAYGSEVTELHTGTDAVLRKFTVNGTPQDMIVSRCGCELYVANEAGWVDVINLATGQNVARIPLAGGGFGMALSPDQVHLYVSIPSQGLVQVVNTQSRKITHTLEVGGQPRRIAFDYHGGIAVVANESGSVNFVR
jgi:YVTN family beta-propeller protein